MKLAEYAAYDALGLAELAIANPRDDKETPGPPQRARNQVAAGSVLAAPGTRRHPVVHAAIAVRADVLEVLVFPRLRAAAPRTESHRIHDAAAAAPFTPAVEFESLRRLERVIPPNTAPWWSRGALRRERAPGDRT